MSRGVYLFAGMPIECQEWRREWLIFSIKRVSRQSCHRAEGRQRFRSIILPTRRSFRSVLAAMKRSILM